MYELTSAELIAERKRAQALEAICLKHGRPQGAALMRDVFAAIGAEQMERQRLNEAG